MKQISGEMWHVPLITTRLQINLLYRVDIEYLLIISNIYTIHIDPPRVSPARAQRPPPRPPAPRAAGVKTSSNMSYL